MKRGVFKIIIFGLLLLLHAWLSVSLGISLFIWFKVQMLNIGLFAILWCGVFWLAKTNPNYVGFAFMLVLMIIIVMFKILAERLLTPVTLAKEQKLVLISSFLVYIVFTVALLIQVLKNMRINEKKD